MGETTRHFSPYLSTNKVVLYISQANPKLVMKQMEPPQRLVKSMMWLWFYDYEFKAHLKSLQKVVQCLADLLVEEEEELVEEVHNLFKVDKDTIVDKVL